MAPFFTGNTCNAFLPREIACTLGNYVSFAVDARDASDYEKTIAFANRHNMRLVIRNTGHDYQGRSTGAGAIAIWTHNIKNMEIRNFASSIYTGKALKIGAGVEVLEAYEFVNRNGVNVVAGNCPTVGLAGGYTQGGGHGPLASKFGLGADQVLEWEVVTAGAKHLIASPRQNSDLYWALCGGGGGTYGAVVSVTVKAHPAMRMAAANLTFGKTEADQFYDVIAAFQQILPKFGDDGGTANWLISPQSFILFPAYLPDKTKADIDRHMQPIIDRLNQHGIQHQYFSGEFPTFLDSYRAMNLPFNVSQFQLGSRLIRRSVVENNNGGLTNAVRTLVEGGTVFSGVSQNVRNSVPSPNAVGANPFWRESIFSAVIGTPYSFTDNSANVRFQEQMTNELIPQLSRLDPSEGAYGNEGDFREPNFKQVFYGSHYDMLDGIKRKYDPDDRFWGATNVGSDRWTQGPDLKLCRA